MTGRPARLLLRAALVLWPAAAHAQQPTVSPFVERVLSRDTTLAVWLFARPGQSPADLATLVTQAGGTVRRMSRWLNAVSASLSTGQITALRRRPELEHIQLVARFVSRPEPLVQAAPALGPAPGADNFGPSIMPFNRLNLLPLVNRNVRGQGVRVAILDTGFETGLPVFAGTTVIAQRDFVNNDSVVRNQAGDPNGQSSHGTSTWSLLGGNQQGTLVGVAPAAEYLLAKTEDVPNERRTEEDNYVAALEWADSLGATIVSSSLGYFDFDSGFAYTQAQLNGDYAVTTIAADAAAQRGITVVTAAGNEGPGTQTLVTPADGDSVIAVGAVDSVGNLAAFSSRGPTADGRIKPDLTAPGVAVWLATPSGFGRSQGTSFSTPLTAGAAALLKQIFPAFGPIDIRDALRTAGSNARSPDSNRGWGTPDVTVAATFPRGIVVQGPVDPVLTTITPAFSWATPDVPAFGLPVRYRLVAATNAALTGALLDTTLAGTSVALTQPLRPGSTLFYRITATGADSAALAFSSAGLASPPWATLTTLNAPGNTNVHERQPTLAWTSPAAASPPGPFRYDVQVVRVSNGAAEYDARNLSATSAVPGPLPYNVQLRWVVTARLGADTATTASAGTFTVTESTLPTLTLLFQNFPNPFPERSTGRRSTCIWFDLATEGAVRLDILDLRGHIVRTLIPGPAFTPPLPAGHYGRSGAGCDPALEWDGTAANGMVVAQGIYLAKLSTPDGTSFKRIVFLGPDI